MTPVMTHLTTHSRLTLRLIYDSLTTHLTTHSQLTHNSLTTQLMTHSWLTLRLIHDSLTTHTRLIFESIMLYDFLYDSSLSQLCFMTSFTTHLWVNYALWLSLQLTSESIMPYPFLYDSPMSQLWFNNFLGFIYDSKVVSTTHTWVSFLDRRSQSGSATETSVEYKRDLSSAPKE